MANADFKKFTEEMLMYRYIFCLKEPEKFTVKKSEKSTTNFWSAPKKKEVRISLYLLTNYKSKIQCFLVIDI